MLLQVIDLIATHGGDVMKFAGDSMIIAFAATAAERQAATGDDGGKRAATLRCVTCAAQLSADYGMWPCWSLH